MQVLGVLPLCCHRHAYCRFPVMRVSAAGFLTQQYVLADMTTSVHRDPPSSQSCCMVFHHIDSPHFSPYWDASKPPMSTAAAVAHLSVSSRTQVFLQDTCEVGFLSHRVLGISISIDLPKYLYWFTCPTNALCYETRGQGEIWPHFNLYFIQSRKGEHCFICLLSLCYLLFTEEELLAWFSYRIIPPLLNSFIRLLLLIG